MLEVHPAIWCLWVHAHALNHSPALYGLIFIISVLSLALPVSLALVALCKLFIGRPIPATVRKSPLLSYIGLSLPGPIQIAVEKELGRQVTSKVWLRVMRKSRGVLHVERIFGSEAKIGMKGFLTVQNASSGMLDNDPCTIKIGSTTKTINIRDGWSVRDLLVYGGLGGLIDIEDMEDTHGGQAFGQLRDGASMGLVYHKGEIYVDVAEVIRTQDGNLETMRRY